MAPPKQPYLALSYAANRAGSNLTRALSLLDEGLLAPEGETLDGKPGFTVEAVKRAVAASRKRRGLDEERGKPQDYRSVKSEAFCRSCGEFKPSTSVWRGACEDCRFNREVAQVRHLATQPKF